MGVDVMDADILEAKRRLQEFRAMRRHIARAVVLEA
jgi:hypothetical protein